MPDLQSALETAVFGRLSAGIVGAPVVQHVREDAARPLVVIGAISRSDQGAKGTGLDLYTVTIGTEVEAQGRKQLTALQTQVRTLLDRWQPPAAGGVEFGEMMPRDDAPTGLSEDAAIYFGAQTYQIFVQG